MIRTEHAHLDVAALTHEGMSGKNNEDRYAVTSYQLDDGDSTPILFAVVADGIGGHRAGEVAAELAVDHISQAVAESDARRPKLFLERAIQEASEAIADHAASASDKKGMGATCACVWIIGNELYTATVGDSRIYLLREGRIQQLSTDHTWVQEAVEKKIITPEQAHDHPNAHVIRRYLGSAEPPEVDFRLRLFLGEADTLAESNQGMKIAPGDSFLICSDGLTDLIWNDEIAEIIRSKPNLSTAAQELVKTANERGGHDNITVVLLKAPHDLNTRVLKKKNWAPWIIGAGIMLLILLAFASTLFINYLQTSVLATSTSTITASPTPTQTQTPTQTPTITKTQTASPTPTGTETLVPSVIEATLTSWPTHTFEPPGTSTP